MVIMTAEVTWRGGVAGERGIFLVEVEIHLETVANIINSLLFLLNIPHVVSLVCQFPKEPTDDIIGAYELTAWYSGAETTVRLGTNQIESYRLYFHNVPNKVLNDTVRRLHADGIQFKIIRKEYCESSDEDDTNLF